MLCVCVDGDVGEVFGGFEREGRAFTEYWCIVWVVWFRVVVEGLIEVWLIWRGRGDMEMSEVAEEQDL